MQKKKKQDVSIAKLLQWQYFKVYWLIFLLGMGMLIIVQVISMAGREKRNVSVYSAECLIKSDYDDIDTKEVSERGGSIQIIKSDLEVITLTGKGPIKERQLTPEKLGRYFAIFGQTEVSATTNEVSFAYDNEGAYWLIVAFPASLEIQISAMVNPKSMGFKEEVIGMFFICLVYLIITGGIIYLMAKSGSKYFVESLEQLQAYTEELTHGDYEKRMERRLAGEFGMLQNKFYELAERLHEKTEENKRMAAQRKEMILDLSHDLKNPLMSIRGYSEILISKDSVEDYQSKQYLRAIKQNSERANRILKGVFQLAYLESGALVLEKKETDLCEFVRLSLAESLEEIQLAGIELKCDIPEEEYWLKLDEMQFRRVWDNLIGNAIKYNKPGSLIKVSLNKKENEISLEIADNGSGMTKGEADKVFEPFVRNDKARNSKTGGSGLGLAIAKKIVEAHGGTIRLETDTNKGCSYKITFTEKN